MTNPEQTAHRHEAAIPEVGATAPRPLTRRPWVAPAAVGGTAVLALIATGVIPLASLVSFAPLAGCALMMVFMHGGHGGHGGQQGAGGHAGHGGPQGAAPQHGQGQAGASVDPVCGMRVDPAVALPQGFASRHEGEDIVFCSRGCRDAFDREPGRYITA